MLTGVVDTLVAKARADAKAQGKAFLGATRAMKVSPYAQAKSWEDFGSRKPSFVAAGDLEVAAAEVNKKRTFERQYREAWLAYQAGAKDVEFPYGTDKMRRLYGVRCKPPP